MATVCEIYILFVFTSDCSRV